MNALDHILEGLEGVRENGSGWMARCPAHEDQHPSLSVKDGGGKVLLHCFAGCENAEILAALGLGMADLFARRPLNWVVVSGSKFTLSTGVGWVALEGRPGGWDAVLYERGSSPRILASGLPLDYAQGVAEDHVRAAGASVLVDRGAPWRRRPASDKQRAALRRMGVHCPSRASAGEASDLISAAMVRRARRSAG